MDEQQVLAITTRILEELRGGKPSKDVSASGRLLVPVGISVRHIHLCRADLDALFGPGSELHKRNDLYQTGEFAAEEAVTILGPKLKPIERVRILGPLRSKTQVEISRTDSISLGASPPVRDSGQLSNSESVILVGPKGVVHLKEGLILAGRHFHCPNGLASQYGLADRQLVRIRITGEKSVLFENVLMRVKETFKSEVHLDTDDGNAAGLVCGDLVEIVA